jgi:hypothetical protein
MYVFKRLTVMIKLTIVIIHFITTSGKLLCRSGVYANSSAIAVSVPAVI